MDSLRRRFGPIVNRFELDIRYPSQLLGTDSLEYCDVQAVEKLQLGISGIPPRPDYATSTPLILLDCPRCLPHAKSSLQLQP